MAFWERAIGPYISAYVFTAENLRTHFFDGIFGPSRIGSVEQWPPSLADQPSVTEAAFLAHLAYAPLTHGTDYIRSTLLNGLYPLRQPYHQAWFLMNAGVSVGFAAYGDGTLTVAARGSRTLLDWVVNCAIEPLADSGKHSGFKARADLVAACASDVIKALNVPVQRVVLTGHSLGGAACLLLAEFIAQGRLKSLERASIETYTFGCPRVALAQCAIHTPVFLFRATGDAVPYLFQSGTVNYVSHMPQMMLDAGGSIYQLASDADAFVFDWANLYFRTLAEVAAVRSALTLSGKDSRALDELVYVIENLIEPDLPVLTAYAVGPLSILSAGQRLHKLLTDHLLEPSMERIDYSSRVALVAVLDAARSNLAKIRAAFGTEFLWDNTRIYSLLTCMRSNHDMENYCRLLDVNVSSYGEGAPITGAT